MSKYMVTVKEKELGTTLVFLVSAVSERSARRAVEQYYAEHDWGWCPGAKVDKVQDEVNSLVHLGKLYNVER